jgi:hypothetical protein
MSRSFLNTNSSSQNEKHDVILKKAIENIHLNSAGASHHENNNTKLTSIDNKITIGQDVKVTGSGLQQVLMYGRHFDGTLHPLETTANDRLLVDVVELTNVGQLTTSSSLPAMQICGFHTGDSRFKSLKCDSDANLILSQASTRSTGTNIVTGATINANLQIGGDIDISNKKSIIILGSATGNHSINILHSADNTNFYLYSSVSPVSHGGVYHYNLKIDNGLQYYKIFNSNQSNTFTLDYVSL